MLRRRKWWTAMALLAVTVTGVAGAAAPAAASTDQWRLVSIWKSVNGGFQAVEATSPGNAWAVGYTEGGGTRNGIAAHWNGKTWQAATIPGTKGVLLTEIAASAASNVWAFGTGKDSYDVKAFRYDGAHWHAMPLPPIDGLGDPVVLGSKDVWLGMPGGCNSVTGKCASDVWHWNGSGWKDFRIGAVITGLTGISDRDLQAVGIAGQTGFGPGIITSYRWNGSHWLTNSIPHVRGSEIPAIAMDSASDVWMAFSAPVGSQTVALHGTGHGWQKVVSPARGISASPDPVPDGHGGVWLGPWSHWTGRTWVDTTDFAAPLSTASWGMPQMVKVPGTSGSYWGAAVVSLGTSTVDHPAIVVYGPVP